MGENGKQAQKRIVSEVKAHLQTCKKPPLCRGQINVKQLAKDACIQRKNFYDNEDVIRLVNLKAKGLGVSPLLFPNERSEIVRAPRVESQGVTPPTLVKELERKIRSLENRVTTLDSSSKDLASENHRLQAEVKRLKRQQFLDDMALQGRPARDTMRQSL